MNIQNKVIEKIKELIPQAPSNWAATIGEQMGKTPDSVYKYARGHRGRRLGYTAEVLIQLQKIVETENERIENLIN